MKRYLIFAAVIPFIGGFWLLLTTTYQSGYFQHADAEVLKLFIVFFKTLQYSYLFGVPPAIMIGAVDDILSHVSRIRPAVRILLVGAFAFIAAELLYGSRGADTGVVQFILYGLVGFIPAAISSWLVQRYVDEPQAALST